MQPEAGFLTYCLTRVKWTGRRIITDINQLQITIESIWVNSAKSQSQIRVKGKLVSLTEAKIVYLKKINIS